jgi:hypothetical protein
MPQATNRSQTPKYNSYQVFASNLKRRHGGGRVLATVNLFIPSFNLHLWCVWERDSRGRETVGLPRTMVTTPDGKAHKKTLVRWHDASAEARFQEAALAAIHQYISNEESPCR